MNEFWYEHIGHMQISVLTLELYSVILKLSKGKVNVLICVHDVLMHMKYKGFPEKVILSEIERFFYGFECREIFIDDERYLSLTHIGMDYIAEIMREIVNQESELAFIVRDSKKKSSVNVIVQESTFYDRNIYNLFEKYHFRKGGARDFLKCLSINELKEFIIEAMSYLNVNVEKTNTNLEECIKMVNNNGKYWSGVASKYSWIFFNQNYYLHLSEKEWQQYKEIINYAKYPVEWGGNAQDIPQTFVDTNNVNIDIFLEQGIVRKLYNKGKFEGFYRLTAPGYLMYERKERGFLLECLLKKVKNEHYSINICEASDKDDYYIYGYSEKNLNGIQNLNFSEMTQFIERQLMMYKDRGGNLFD